MPVRTPKKWDLVSESLTGEPAEYVVAVKKPRSTTIVQICVRGAKPGFKTCRTMGQPEFLQAYTWNADGRHLAGTWEPRSEEDRQDEER